MPHRQTGKEGEKEEGEKGYKITPGTDLTHANYHDQCMTTQQATTTENQQQQQQQQPVTTTTPETHTNRHKQDKTKRNMTKADRTDID